MRKKETNQMKISEKMSEKMNEIYQTNITDEKWIAYDIPGNVGWLMYVIGLIVFTIQKMEYIKTKPMLLMLVLAAIPAVAMIAGVFELINERIHKLDRLLPKKRLLRGFGALMYGGLGGTIISLIIVLFRLMENQGANVYFVVMGVGAALCMIFGWLLYKGYHKCGESAGGER